VVISAIISEKGSEGMRYIVIFRMVLATFFLLGTVKVSKAGIGITLIISIGIMLGFISVFVCRNTVALIRVLRVITW